MEFVGERGEAIRFGSCQKGVFQLHFLVLPVVWNHFPGIVLLPSYEITNPGKRRGKQGGKRFCLKTNFFKQIFLMFYNVLQCSHPL